MTRSVFFDVRSEYSTLRYPFSERNHYALAPLLDGLNHKNVYCEAGFNPSNSRYEIRSAERFSKGSQVFISYGLHSNATLLIEYGFTLPRNVNNVVYLSLPKMNPNPIGESFLTEMQLMPSSSFSEEFYAQESNLSWNYLFVMRCLCSSSKEECEQALEDLPIAPMNECKMWKTILFHCFTLIDSRNDPKDLSSHSETSANVRQVAEEELLILKSIIQLAQSHLSQF